MVKYWASSPAYLNLWASLAVHTPTFPLPQVIKEQQEAIARLVKIAKEDSEDLETIRQGLANKA